MILVIPAINTSRPNHSPSPTNHFYTAYVNLFRRRPDKPTSPVLSARLIQARPIISIRAKSNHLSEKNLPASFRLETNDLYSMCWGKNKIDRKERITTDAVLSPPWSRCAASACSTFVPCRINLAKVFSQFLSLRSLWLVTRHQKFARRNCNGCSFSNYLTDGPRAKQRVLAGVDRDLRSSMVRRSPKAQALCSWCVALIERLAPKAFGALF
jgi:hypothetical protein